MPINYSTLPEYMRGPMARYIEHGEQPGGFLTALLSNDLMGALRKGDDTNQAALSVYGRFLYNEAPGGCYGSPETVSAWCMSGGLFGLRERAKTSARAMIPEDDL